MKKEKDNEKKEEKGKVVLIIRDGWGYRKSRKKNAIAEAKTSVDDELKKKYPYTLLAASGKAVGLPDGYQGNSEVGHLTIGSGRIMEQSLERINKSIKDESFFKKKELLGAIRNSKKNNSRLHIIGLLQKEGVHAHMDHLFALLRLCKKEKFNNVFIHTITDGRDAPVKRGKTYLKELIKKTKDLEVGEVATLCGRYYAMDRDQRWDRTKKAYDAIVGGKSKEKFKNPVEKLNQRYRKGETDEFVYPTTKEGYGGIKNGDSIIFYNLRTDRPRQLTQAIVEKKFQGWKRTPPKVFFVAMTAYYSPMNAEVVFKEKEFKNLLGKILSRKKIKQLRISETEKYAHVTFFFNGQKEKPLKGETRIMVPSPKVGTYDKKPEMSIKKVLDKTKKEIEKNEYQFIVVNFVNADMVGHSGNKKAIIKAVEAVDRAVGETVEAGLRNDYSIFVFADHGNAEDQTKNSQTSHTVNLVPFILVSSRKKMKLKKDKGLKDIAPTVLKMMGIEKPKEMTGSSVFE